MTPLRNNRNPVRRVVIPLLVVWLGLFGLSLTGAAGALLARQAEGNGPLVIDRAGILDEGQERSAVNDAYRLGLYGIPTQVITEPVGLNQVQANARADELLISQGIETQPGANDGLLVYVSTDLYDPSNIVMSIAVGARTLPRNGFTADALDGVRARIVAVQLAFGHPARAVVYSLREMIYLEQYVPPSPPALSGWRTAANPFVDVLGPLLAATGSAWVLVNGRPAQAPRPILMAAIGAMAVGIAIVAVATRSEPGVVASLALGGLVIWQGIGRDRAGQSAGSRMIRLSPRHPGSRRPARSARTST